MEIAQDWKLQLTEWKQLRSTVVANVGNEREIVRKVGLAEAKQQPGDIVQKKASKKSQQALQEKPQCMDEEIS